jgi:iron complex outermembrane receptor protein
VGSEALLLHPVETTFYGDLHATTPFEAGGRHELVTGVALTFGSTKGDAQGFEFDQALSAYPPSASVGMLAAGEKRDFEDERTFFGVYAHDEWTPVARFSLSGGGRWDSASEGLEVGGDEGGGGEVDAKDNKSTQAFSGDLGALVRLAPAGSGALGSLNLFGNWKSAFKPAAPNLTEAEDAKILDPERTHSLEGGLRASMFDEQFGLEASMFQMDFHNLVVANLGPGGSVDLINAGHERFKGYELSLGLSPEAVPGLTLRWGYAHHDARFVEFTFVTPDSQLRNVSGKRLELAPADMWNASFSYRAPFGAGLWAAVREQGERPLTRRNTFFTPSFTEWDAGASYEHGPMRVAVVGRNLGDDRHPVAESEIGDSQFYISAPRRVMGEVSYRF